MAYRRATSILLCFDVNRPDSLSELAKTFLPEIAHHTSFACAYILVGCKSDANYLSVEKVKRLHEKNTSPITREQAIAFAKESKCFTYVETSAQFQRNCEEAFKAAHIAHYAHFYGLKGNILQSAPAASNKQQNCNVQ